VTELDRMGECENRKSDCDERQRERIVSKEDERLDEGETVVIISVGCQ
jgi:hypothetical protein